MTDKSKISTGVWPAVWGSLIVVIFSVLKAYCAGVALPLSVTILVVLLGIIIRENAPEQTKKSTVATIAKEEAAVEVIDEDCARSGTSPVRIIEHTNPNSKSDEDDSTSHPSYCESGAEVEDLAANVMTKETEHTDSSSSSSEEEKSDDENELDPRLAEEERVHDIPRARELKEKGNELFKAGNFIEAQEAYTDAILCCSEEEKDLYSALFSNRAACYQSLEEWDCVIRDSTEAIKHKEDFVKAYHRRCKAYEVQNKMQDALSDLKKILELDPSQRPRMEGHLKVVEKKAAEQFERDKEEMMGKLKEMGNSLLGNFGMSVDNFKWVQDPATGSYSVSYQN